MCVFNIFQDFSFFINSLTVRQLNSLKCKGALREAFNNFANEADLVLLDFSLTVKAATLIFISWCGSAISSAKEGKSGFVYNLVKS